MSAKTLMITALAGLVATAAHALTSDEIAAALDVDPSIGTFSLSGDVEWQIDTEAFEKGTSSLKSGQIERPDDWKYCVMSLTVDIKEPCRLDLRFKTYAQASNTSDNLFRIRVDNVYWDYTGQRDWTSFSTALLEGAHVITFSYQKRWYNNGHNDNYAWIDSLQLEPILLARECVTVTNITCTQRTPWNGMVDIDYTVTAEDPNADIWVYPVGYDKDSNTSMAPRALTGDGVGAAVKPGRHRMTWNVTEDYPEFHSTAFTVKMTALTGAAPYMVVDLSGGVDALSYPVSYLSSVPAGGWGEEYKTTKMAFRLIPPGSFMMGSPTDEADRGWSEDRHGVALTKPFYLGVFECTQKQYELVMGTRPAYRQGDLRPVERVSYDNIRGSVNGSGWPTHNQVDANSFMGRLRSKANMLFDLPTEAQWEYACRAGTATALNNGKSNTDRAVCEEIARCWYNYRNYSSDGQVWDQKGGYTETTVVGCYRPNAWELYDMHGNVGEWCRDCGDNSLGYAGAINPKGASSASYNYRVWKGAAFWHRGELRSAWRSWMSPRDTSDGVGFRVFCSPVAE